MKKNTASVDTGENKAYTEAMLGKRSSNAAGPHLDKRTKRLRTRAAKKTQSINEQRY